VGDDDDDEYDDVEYEYDDDDVADGDADDDDGQDGDNKLDNGNLTNRLVCFRVASIDSVGGYTKTSAVEDLHFSLREAIENIYRIAHAP
jgi:hypothetical protein